MVRRRGAKNARRKLTRFMDCTVLGVVLVLKRMSILPSVSRVMLVMCPPTDHVPVALLENLPATTELLATAVPLASSPKVTIAAAALQDFSQLSRPHLMPAPQDARLANCLTKSHTVKMD